MTEQRKAERFDWADKYHELVAAGSPRVEDIELLATAALLLGHTAESVAAFGRSYEQRLKAGETVEAIRSAFWAAFQLLNRGDFGQGAAWVSRLGRAAEEEPKESTGRAYALAQFAFRQVAVENDFATGQAIAADAVSIGRRNGEVDIVALALTVQARATLRLGAIKDGLAIFDEAMLEVIGGAATVPAIGAVYCSVIGGCHEVFDFRRAQEWTEVLSTWSDRQPGMLVFRGQCLVLRSRIRLLEGEWKAALADVDLACEHFLAAEPHLAGSGWYQRAEVQRLMGELSAAESSYHQASEFGEDPQPGLGLLWLAQEKGQAALAAVQRAREEAEGPWLQARYLPALVEIALMVGQFEVADNAARDLSSQASALDMPMLNAIAAKALGSVALAAGEARSALPKLRESQRVWRRLAAPYEEARVRLLIAKCCRAIGDDASAHLEQEAARKAFAAVGARFELEQFGRPTPAENHGLSRREIEVLGLLVGGETNQAIADHLFLAVRTVDRHVSNILAKLGVSSRTAATTYALKHGLVRDLIG
ncbi:MAG: LuxR C-terminal-related transcriptional regulator [Acidimicrobiia bacterium]